MKHHGMSMLPPSSSGGGGGRKRPPSGTAHPVVASSKNPGSDGFCDDSGSISIVRPMPVILTMGTLIKLASLIIVPLLGMISAGIYYFHKTNIHMTDPTVHLTRGERGKLETKAEAKQARKKMEITITREIDLKTRELRQDLSREQKIQIKKLGDGLQNNQKVRMDRLLKEIKRTRRDIVRNHR